jgi:hypothetical protein
LTPDARNATPQRYCSKPACRKQSKPDSQRRWLQKPENHDYFRQVTLNNTDLHPAQKDALQDLNLVWTGMSWLVKNT